MKLQVVGWTYYDDLRFPEGEDSYASNAAIMADIRAHGYHFTGWHHEEDFNGAPILNDGRIYRYSQRGWGALMADVYEEKEPYAYVNYAFSFGEKDIGIRLPNDECNIDTVVMAEARKLLSKDSCDRLAAGNYTVKFPHPELDELALYPLTEAEVDSLNLFAEVYQLPTALTDRLFGRDLTEHFPLDSCACTQRADRISLPMAPTLAYLAPGDTVTYNGSSYTVKAVEQYKNVSEEIKLRAMYTMNEGYAEAKKLLDEAELYLDIFI